jgi:hypothetical protein
MRKKYWYCSKFLIEHYQNISSDEVELRRRRWLISAQGWSEATTLGINSREAKP